MRFIVLLLLTIASVASAGAQEAPSITVLPFNNNMGTTWATKPNGNLTILSAPHYLIIQGLAAEPLVSIDLQTGNVIFGKDYTLDETARVFWQALGRQVCK